MSEIAPPLNGAFSREVSPDLLWTGGCLDFNYLNTVAHSHFSIFLLKGSEKSILVDTGHPIHWPAIERYAEKFLAGRPLDYVFITHGEFPHGGALPQWLNKYPDAVCVGPMVDYDFYYPEFADRIRTVTAGDSLDLGDRNFVFLPAIWRDLPKSLWAFDTTARTLFVADAFAFLHYHRNGECDRTYKELGPPDMGMMQFFNERALQWTRFSDASVTFDDVAAIMQRLKPRLIAPAHGNLVTDPEAMLPQARESMLVGPMHRKTTIPPATTAA
jgi:flavorubredoxin